MTETTKKKKARRKMVTVKQATIKPRTRDYTVHVVSYWRRPPR